MRLYLIRHGQSFVNLKDWNQGNLDTALTPKGIRQAEALAEFLPAELPTVDAIYASTMRRAAETAEIVAAAYAMPVIADPRLREVGNNRLDQTPFPNEELPGSYADYWASERPFSSVTPATNGGETFMHFRIRVGQFIEEAATRHQGETVLAVCHGGVVECAFDHIFNVGPWRRCEVWDHNTAVTCFEHVEIPGRETWRLHYHNRIPHLVDFEGEDDQALHGTPLVNGDDA
ncbi:MAG: histidine phosphatase family protein [Caldilineaceae bacterium]|nr:histidine phosphatase family protein [Caldilineaceae bacterium]